MSAISLTDSRSVERLYRDHHPWLLGWLQRWLGSAEEAADIAADTFVQLLAAPVADPETPRALLTVIARRLVWRQWRQRGLEQQYLKNLPEDVGTEALEPTVHRTRLLDRLRHALARIPAVLGQTFVLAHLHDFSHRQIAARLGISLRSVGLYLVRVRRHCARLFDPGGM